MKHFLAYLCGIAVFVSTTFCAATDCQLLLTVYQDRPNAKDALELLGVEATAELSHSFGEKRGYSYEISAIARVFFASLENGLSPAQCMRLTQLRTEYDLVAVRAVPSTREMFSNLLRDPLTAFTEHCAQQQQVEASVSRVEIPRELYGIQPALDLTMLKEIQRIGANESRPWWDDITIVSISNPFPMESLRNYKLVKLLAKRQWLYINLIPPKYHDRIFEELRSQKRVFVERSHDDSVQREVNEMFDTVELLISQAINLPMGDFIELQAKKYSWKRQLAFEYGLKAAWAGLVGFMVWISCPTR